MEVNRGVLGEKGGWGGELVLKEGDLVVNWGVLYQKGERGDDWGVNWGVLGEKRNRLLLLKFQPRPSPVFRQPCFALDRF